MTGRLTSPYATSGHHADVKLCQHGKQAAEACDFAPCHTPPADPCTDLTCDLVTVVHARHPRFPDGVGLGWAS